MITNSVIAVMDFPPQVEYPNGFAPRAHHLLKAIGEQASLDVVALHRGECDWTGTTFLPHGFPVRKLFCESVGDNPLYRSGIIGKARRLFHYLCGKRSAMAYPARLPSLEAIVKQQKPGLVVVFLPHVAHLSFPLPPDVPCLYVLEEGLERSYIHVSPDMAPWKRQWVDKAERSRARRTYKAIRQRNAAVIAISEKERQWFAQFLPDNLINVVPHGIDCDYYSPRYDGADADIDVAVFGGLGQRRTYEPTLELHNLLEAQPSVTQPPVSWAFVGQSPHESLQALRSPRVLVTGFVEDVRPYYSRSKVVVVPSQTGGGVKTTVLQAWAMGRPVVATPFALTGLPAKHGQNVLIGNTTQELIEHIHTLLASPELQHEIGCAGRETVERERNVRTIAKDFAKLCLNLAGVENSSPAHNE